MLVSTRLLLPVRVLLTVLLVGLTFLAAPPAQAAPADEAAPDQGAGSDAAPGDDTPDDEEGDESEPVRLAPAAQAKRPRRLGVRKPRPPRHKRALKVARRQIGDPYRYGATGPGAFDCSGLVKFSYNRAGLKRIPRTSKGQASFARRIPRTALRPGDLMFFTGGGGVYHVGIFAGRKRGKVVMVHAPSTGKRVSRAHPWTNAWYAATVR